MKFIVTIIIIVSLCYLLILAAMFLFQRNLLFYSVPFQSGIDRQEIAFDNDGVKLHGWVLNPGQKTALIYFGGNSEAIQNNIIAFESIFDQHSVYLIHYRGYGRSEGKPSEVTLFSDALKIYDEIRSQHTSINVMGRSLGSGVAVYLASKRDTEKLILLTPYDSIAEVAQHHYPFLPAKYIARDRFESFRYAVEVSAPVLIVTAEFDRVVPTEHALKLREYFSDNQVSYHLIEGVEHNDVHESPEYQQILRAFTGDSG